MATDIGKSLKGIWMKGMEAIGNTASTIASSTKYKVNEMNLVNRRREILSDFGAISYELWQKGEKFPEELDSLLRELSDLDQMLNDLRAERLAGVDTTGETESENSDQTEETETQTEAEAVTLEKVPESAETVTEETETTEKEQIPVIEVRETAEETEKPDGEDTAFSFMTAMEELGNAVEARCPDLEQKVDQTIDAVSETFQKVSVKIDEGLRELAEKLSSEDHKE